MKKYSHIKKYIKKFLVTASSLAVCLSTLAPCTSSKAFPWDNSLWQVIGKAETLASANNNPKLSQEINKISQDKLTIMQDARNAQPYLYYIYQEIVKRHIPAELAFLPMVESDYYPYSRSSCGAEGLWQLMSENARDHHIKMDWWFEGRRDFMSSTQAGLDNLEHLHKVFGDWLLAMAAYNTGAGNVLKAIKYNKKHHLPTDFWSLKLSKQTEEYVPKILALAAIFKDPGKYHVRLPKIENSSQVTLVKLDKPVNLAELAQLIHMDSDELLRLNPGFLRWVTPKTGTYSLVVPNNKVSAVLAALPTFTPENLWYHYHVTKTDTLKSIATQYNVSTETLTEVNNLTSKHVKAGENLLIPIDYATHSNLYAANSPRLALPAPGKSGKIADFATHVVSQATINKEQKLENTFLAAEETSHPPAIRAAAKTQNSVAGVKAKDVQAANKPVEKTIQPVNEANNNPTTGEEKKNLLNQLYRNAIKKFFSGNNA